MNGEGRIKAVATALGLASLAAQAVVKVTERRSPAHRALERAAQREMDRRVALLTRNIALKEQEERDVALIEELARHLDTETVFGTEYAGRWRFGAVTNGERLYSPMDEGNFPRGPRTIWAIRRMMLHGTQITNPRNASEAMGTRAVGSVGAAQYGNPERRPGGAGGVGDPGRRFGADQGRPPRGDPGTRPVAEGGEGDPGEVPPTGGGGDPGDGR